MSWPTWLPYVGIIRLTVAEQRELGCDPAHCWSALGGSWGEYTYVLLLFSKI